MKKTVLLFVPLLIALAGRALPATSNAAAALTINDGFTGTLLNSDGGGTYSDHNLPSGDICVTAWVASNGLFFIYLDYNAAYGNPGQCDNATGIDGTPQDRTYSLTFSDSSGICPALGLGASGSPCTLVVDNSPRIRVAPVFSTKASTAVQFEFYVNGNSYELNTDSGASVSGSGNTQTYSYNGTVTLWQIFPAGTQPKQVGSSFTFPFSFTVQDYPGVAP